MEMIQTERGLEIFFTIALPHGLHSRPSARLAQLAREFSSSIILIGENGEADAKSMLDILSLAPNTNSKIKVLAKGPDAAQALEAIYNFFSNYQE